MKIYVDGSYRASTDIGAYGVLLFNAEGEQMKLSGIEQHTTNNKMELMAMITALEFCIKYEVDKANEIEIFCDSQYVVKGLTEWWDGWVKKGFKTTTGPVKNLDLWKKLVALHAQVKCKITWVKGHASNERHNEVDELVAGLTANAKL